MASGAWDSPGPDHRLRQLNLPEGERIPSYRQIVPALGTGLVFPTAPAGSSDSRLSHSSQAQTPFQKAERMKLCRFSWEVNI